MSVGPYITSSNTNTKNNSSPLKREREKKFQKQIKKEQYNKKTGKEVAGDLGREGKTGGENTGEKKGSCFPGRQSVGGNS